jgi:hypothetical protein
MSGSNSVDGVADIDGETADHALERGIGQRHDGQLIRAAGSRCTMPMASPSLDAAGAPRP